VIKSAGSPVHCNNIAPPRYKVGGKWYCSYPELRECHDPAMLPVDEVKVDPVNMNDIELGKSIYTKKQLEEFAAFQIVKGHARPSWQRLPNWPTSAGMRKESGVWHRVPKRNYLSSIWWG
jgi:hypothetical protein